MLFCAGHALMADGRLVVSGGHTADDQGLDVTNIFNPVTETWVGGLPKYGARPMVSDRDDTARRQVADCRRTRYHRRGRRRRRPAFPAERNHEIYWPLYLFKGARPVIVGSPGEVDYGQTFTVSSTNARQIVDVRWIRPGSVTHAFNANQRANRLDSVTGDGALIIITPATPPLHRRAITCFSFSTAMGCRRTEK
jgi:hypothetical protein